MDTTTSPLECSPGAGLADDEPVVMHDEFAQLVTDATACFRAVSVLMALLRDASPDNLDAGDRLGVSVLLESVRNRLELTVDGLGATACALGVPVERMVLQ